MASTLLTKAGKKLFEKHLEHYTPPDPLYEYYTTDRGKRKRRERTLPPGLSKRDAKILRSLQRRAHHLDKSFTIASFSFGYTFFIGLVPVVGDIINIYLYYRLIIRKAAQADLPDWLMTRLYFNNIVSAGVGFVPFVGDVALAVWKASWRNAALVEEFMRIRGEEYLRMEEARTQELEGNAPGDGPTTAVPGSSTDGNARGRNKVIVADQSGPKQWLGSFRKKGLNEKDVRQVKPGSGMKAGEIIPTVPIDSDSVDENRNISAAGENKKGFFGRKGTAKKS